MVLLVIILIWAAFLLPPLIRQRLDGNPVESIGKFNRHLRVLRSTTPAASALAGSAHTTAMPTIWVSEARRLAVQRRRRQVAKSLLVTAAATFVGALLPDLQFLFAVHLLVDVLLVTYLVSLAQVRRQEAERRVAAEFDQLRVEMFSGDGTGPGNVHSAAL